MDTNFSAITSSCCPTYTHISVTGSLQVTVTMETVTCGRPSRCQCVACLLIISYFSIQYTVCMFYCACASYSELWIFPSYGQGRVPRCPDKRDMSVPLLTPLPTTLTNFFHVCNSNNQWKSHGLK